MENRKIGRTSKKLIHCIAHCEECNFMAEWYLTASREATKHAKETGHRVAIEQGIHYKVFPLFK